MAEKIRPTKSKIGLSRHKKRERSGITQLQLAKALDTTQRRVSYLESGKIEPDLASLWKIADTFDVSLDELIGRDSMRSV